MQYSHLKAHRAIASLLRLNRNQPMLGLPLLIWILTVCHLEELMIIHRCLFEILQVIERGGAQEISSSVVGHKLGAYIERFQDQRIVFIFARGECKVAVRGTQFWLQLYSCKKFLLRLGELLQAQQRL